VNKVLRHYLAGIIWHDRYCPSWLYIVEIIAVTSRKASIKHLQTCSTILYIYLSPKYFLFLCFVYLCIHIFLSDKTSILFPFLSLFFIT